MGVRGLFGFVTRNKEIVCTTLPIGNYQKVIIDSNNFLYHVYEGTSNKYKFNGEYDLLQKRIIEFFQLLEQHKLQPYFVFDGVHRQDAAVFSELDKLKLKIKNLEKGKYTARLPLLAQELLMYEVKKKYEGMAHARADFVADSEIVALANKLGCPVMSNDADFFIHDVTHGVIPFANLKRVSIGVHIFQQKVLFKKLPGLCPKKMAIYAALRTFENLMKHLISQHHVEVPDIWSETRNDQMAIHILYWLNGETIANIKTEIDAELDQKAKDFWLITTSYEHTQTNLDRYLTGKEVAMPAELKSFSTPPWFYKMFQAGRMSTNSLNSLVCGKIMFNFQLEDIDKPSTWEASRPIRKAMYEIMHNGSGEDKRTIVEYGREGRQFKECTVQVSKNEHLPRFQDLKEESKKEEKDDRRRHWLVSILEVSKDLLKFFKEHGEQDGNALVVFTLSFCVKHASTSVSTQLVKSILVSIYAKYDTLKDEWFPETGELSIIHGIAQYQACLHSAVELNQLLLCPLEEPDLGAMMWARVQHKLCATLKEKTSTKDQNDFIREKLDGDQFRRVLKLHDLVESHRI